MIQHKSTLFIGIFIILIETFFGIPSSWKVFLLVVCGLALIALSVKITLPKKTLGKRPRRREKITPVFTENVPMDSRIETHAEKETDDIVM